MKKLFTLLALALAVASCQKDNNELNVVVGGEQDVNITVSLPDETRADSAQGFDFTNFEENGNYDLRFILEIAYNGNVVREVNTSNTTSTTFPVRLAPGREYTFTVWADLVNEDSQEDLCYNVLTNDENGVSALTNITLKETLPANVELRDAYTYTSKFKFGENPSDLDMILTRPFAKVRVVATDLADVTKFGIVPNNAAVVYKSDVHTSFNAVTGNVNEDTDEPSFTYNISANNYGEVSDANQVNDRLTVFADYIFVPEDGGTISFNLDINQDRDLIKANSFNTTIPVAKNKVTSIVGDVLTEGGNVSITINGDLGEKETFTYISSGAELLKVIKDQDSGKYILGCNIDVDENDVALAGTLSATRSTTTETVINLNGYTITINNKSNESLVTLADGNTLVFAGEGAIVMDADSTAPFVENKNTNGGVIIEQATLTNNSTNATIVDGTAVVNEGVEIEGNVASVTTSQLDYVLANGGEVTLLQDVTSDKILEISATNPIVINGNGKTISFTYNRGFRVTASNNVTIENATIVNNVDNGRCIETRTGNINLTLNNVTLTATQTGSQPFTVGGTGIDVTVNINNSTINAGKGYGITTFNPTALTINNSTVTGYAALNIKAASGSEGSAGSVINVTGSTLAGVNNWSGVSNAFSTIMLEDSNVTINIDSTSTVKAFAKENTQSVFSLGNELVDTPIDNCDITIAGTVVLEGEEDALYAFCSTKQGSTGTNVVKFNAEYAEGLQTEGWIVSEPTDNLVTITSAVAELNGNGYATFEAAVAAAKAGDIITLLKDVKPTNLPVLKDITLKGNGQHIDATINGDNLTIAGHIKVTLFSGSNYNRNLTILEGSCLEVTSTDRVSLGFGNTWTVTGSIKDAKTADKANIKPSLIIPGGVSITGGYDAALNVENAYVIFGSTSSKNSSANGEFTLNFNNSIVDFTNQFTFAEPTNGKTPKFNLNIKDSVLTTATKLCVAAANSNIFVDNSVVTLGTYLRNSGNVEIKNGSVVTGSTIQFGENGGNNGAIKVDASSLTINATSTGHAFDGKGVGSINLTNDATATVTYYKDMTITVDETSTFTGTEVQ